MEWNVIRPLTNAAIDEISGKAEEFLTDLNTDPKNLLRIRLILEEILLGWQSVFSSEAPCRIRLDKRLGRPYLQLELEGKPCNPLEQDTEEYGAYRGRLLANMGLSPLYSYENGKNKIIFKLKKKKSNPLLSLASLPLPRSLWVSPDFCCRKQAGQPCWISFCVRSTKHSSICWEPLPVPWFSCLWPGEFAESAMLPPSVGSANGCCSTS